ncbi:MAG: Na/Pi cotransporter family protein [Oscillospiraceae bacterium]|nr:Na/Pi cotransporter family protein [Oscillospiraceae bacterium]
MDILTAIVQLLGGLAMFLYGIEVMGDGLKNSSGAALKRVLEKVTGNVLMGVLTGALVTAVIQSSTATIVLTVALIGAGVLTLKQAVSIVMGANIGTTITAQIIRLGAIESDGSWFLWLFDTDTLAPIALVIGIILIMFIKKRNTKAVGDIAIGFGVLFVGLNLMTDGVKPLIGTDAFTAFVQFLTNPAFGIAFGLILTVIVQSSSATVGMLQTVAQVPGSGITFAMAYPVIMGINLGTCVTTAMVCSIGSGKDAKRTGIVHIAFNTIGTVVFLAVMLIMQKMQVFGEAFWLANVDSGGIANFQTIFNLLTAVLLLPFTNLLVMLSKTLVKDEAEKPARHPELTGLDEKLYISPAVALSEATKAIAFMGTVAQTNFRRCIKQLVGYDPALSDEIAEDESALDQFSDKADHFLIGLSKHVETDADNHELDMLLQVIPSFERIGDYATNLEEIGEKMHAEETTFSEKAIKELNILTDAVDEILSTTIQALTDNDTELAKTIEPLEEVIDDMVRLLRDRHTKRLKTGSCTVTSGLQFMDALTHLERASDHCSSIAVLMLARDNEEILGNHYDYLRELHEGTDKQYVAELRRRREQYVDQLYHI